MAGSGSSSVPRQLSLSFAAGVAGAVVNLLAAWMLSRMGVFHMLGCNLSVSADKPWIYSRPGACPSNRRVATAITRTGSYLGWHIWFVSGSARADQLSIETRPAAGTTARGVPTFCRVPDFPQTAPHGIKPRPNHAVICPVSESALGFGRCRLAENDRMTPCHPRTRAPVQCLVSDRRSMGQIGDGTHWTAGILPAPATRQKPAVHLR